MKPSYSVTEREAHLLNTEAMRTAALDAIVQRLASLPNGEFKKGSLTVKYRNGHATIEGLVGFSTMRITIENVAMPAVNDVQDGQPQEMARLKISNSFKDKDEWAKGTVGGWQLVAIERVGKPEPVNQSKALFTPDVLEQMAMTFVPIELAASRPDQRLDMLQHDLRQMFAGLFSSR